MVRPPSAISLYFGVLCSFMRPTQASHDTGLARRVINGSTAQLSSNCWMVCRLSVILDSSCAANFTVFMDSVMNRSVPWLFQLRLRRPGANDLSILSRYCFISGRSTGSSCCWMLLCMLMIKSRLPVCLRNVSAFL